MAGDLSRGEVRFFRFPSPDKQRPVLVLTRNSALEFLNRVTVAPITSTIRGSPTEVVLGVEDGMKHPSAVNLDHVITVPRAGIGKLIGHVSPARLTDVCRALAFAVGCRWEG